MIRFLKNGTVHFYEGIKSLKRLLLTAAFLVGLMPMAFSQSANAVFLKDGTKVVGYVQDMDPAGSVSIRTTDGRTLSLMIWPLAHPSVFHSDSVLHIYK